MKKAETNALLLILLLCLTAPSLADGLIEGHRFFGGGGVEILSDATLAPDGENIFLVGSTTSSDGDIQGPGADGLGWAVLTSGEGEIVWQVALWGKEGNLVYPKGCFADETGYYVCGLETTGVSFLQHIDESGRAGDRVYYESEIHGMVETPHGILLMGGLKNSSVPWASMVDGNGQELWSFTKPTKAHGGRDVFGAFIGAAVVPDGAVMVGMYDDGVHLDKIGLDGEVLWTRNMGEQSFTDIRAIVADGENIVVAGRMGNGASSKTAAALLTGDANVRWSTAVGADGGNTLWDIAIMPGGYLLCGGYWMDGREAAWVIALDKLGTLLRDEPIPLGSTSNVKAVMPGNDGALWVAGDADVTGEHEGARGALDYYIGYLQRENGFFDLVR